jgi:DNA mismatch repair ATPase MutL
MPHQAQDKGEHSGVNAQIKPDAKATGEMKADSKAKESDSSSSKEMKNPTAETKSPASDSKSKASESTTPAPTAKSPTAETKSPASDNKTTGNAATTATAAPPAEKQTQIVSAIKQEKVEEVTNVNFNISIGTAVPSSVRFYPLPARIVEIYPEWRGYDFIRVHGRYIILRPHTREIVYIIEG